MVRLIFGLLILGACCSFTAHANEAAEAAIKAAYNDIHQRFLAGDVGDVGSDFYTEDALFFPPMGGKIDSTEGITQSFAGMLEHGLVLKPVPVEIEVYGDVAYERGIGYLSNQQGELLSKDDYMVIWKKEEGQWKIYRDLVRGTPPPAN
ncbi:DUF4440 domain-containing protein [Pseudidiomarina sp. CB1]|uniref:YybH family protein n=1 Tax=Pseudidiomarina sp. CB1 TaxID=2972484 RepID=UPI002163FE26|nr:DUF4440 domain-containing protein [Pseudidiomarina sp. CB1]